MARFPALIGLLLGLLAGCGAAMDAGPRTELGRGGDPELIQALGGAYQDPATQLYLEGIVLRLLDGAGARDQASQWSITLIDTPSINAFALPDGSLYVTRGLMALANSEDQLAAVIAHEIGHVLARHPEARARRAQEARNVAALGVMLGRAAGLDDGSIEELADAGRLAGAALVAEYSRDQELQADALSIGYLAAAGYDPRAAVQFLRNLGAQQALRAEMSGVMYDPGSVDFLSTHPATAQRIAEAERVAAIVAPGPGLPLMRGVYLPQLDGMIYGDPPSQGYVRNGGFVHPELRFAFQAPDGFRITNSSTAVAAEDGAGGLFVLEGAPPFDGPLTAFVRERWVPLVTEATETGPLRELAALRINGLEAARAVMRVETRRGPADMLFVAVRVEDQIYRLSGLAPRGSGLLPALDAAALTFRELDLLEAAALEPNRLVIRRVQPGDTVESLAQGMAVEGFAEERFRVLNGLGPDDALSPGMLVKIVR